MAKTPRINDQAVFILSILSLVALILDYGYPDNFLDHLLTDFFYVLYAVVISLFLFNTVQATLRKKFKIQGIHLVFLLSAILLVVSIANTIQFVIYGHKGLNFLTALLVLVLTLFDLSGRIYSLHKQTLHPALVFVLSFLVVIFIGTLMLMLPNATENGIGFVDALFTSTSAVCVTGLVILDTGKDFTIPGQLTILMLIQVGGLGMLSFTALFGLLFKGFGSYENRLNLKNMINAETLEDTFKTLIQILVFVFMVEAVGAVLIFFTLDIPFDSFTDRVFFSLFHSVSAFCNAGFSLLTNSLAETGYAHNYQLHLVIAGLIVLGGIGYGVIINLYEYAKKFILFHFRPKYRTSADQKIRLRPNLSLNSKLVLITTIVLIVAGTVLFYWLERDGTLKNHSGWGQVVTSLFASITTRTAGFNTVDTGSFALPTLMIVLLLMWIGASPGSTGGGIKTTTFAVATLNIVQQVFGYKNIRVGWKRVQQGALQRATSIISLSLIMIGLSTFLLVTFDGQMGVMPLAFEAFSAFSTVGLSMGITSSLSTPSKLTIILTMFVGRVGFLTLLTGMVQQIVKYRYSAIEYPEEEIFIN